jgi:two-component system chemotaxis sensor kinase CheA
MPNDSLPADKEFYLAFLDDYFADCDEHITLARRKFVELEASIGQPCPDRAILDSLFRSFHTLKGLSGMVSLAPAEELAHQIESYLEALRAARVVLSAPALQTLEAAVQLLEQVIAARRTQQTPPDIAALQTQLAGLLTTGTDSLSAAPSASAPPTRVERPTTPPPDVRLWRFDYTPTRELAARGVTVETVRVQLRELGEINSATPKLTATGSVAFEFVVATQCAEEAFASLRQDGLAWAAMAAPAPAADATVAPETAGAPAPSSRQLAPANVVRVDLTRLDDLMRLVGELVTSRARLEDQLRAVEVKVSNAQWRDLQETNLTLERHLRDLREGVMRVRLVPMGEAFERMRFVVRDLARQSGRTIRLELNGQRTEIDKLVVERMMDPLLHLVRNAVSHGLESPEDRVAAGKPAEGRLSLHAVTAGDSVLIEIEDDGRGIDTEQVTARARALGLIAPEAALDAHTLLDVLCAPGFSTRATADRASGRGVGMSVVKKTVLELGGTLTLETRRGHGTKFTLQLPLTLMIVDALIVSVSGQTLAIPQPALREVIQIERAALTALENNEVMAYRDAVLPLLRLGRLFRWPETRQPTVHVLVVGAGLRAVGLVVDRIIGQREIVVRALADPLVQVPGIAGATELSDGRVILILDAAGLTRIARHRGANPGRVASAHHARLEIPALESPRLAAAPN